jgi:hypothetical protein
VRGVADHQRAFGRHVEFFHQFVQHARIAACRVSSAVREPSKALAQCHRLQRLVEPAARLARGHGQLVAARAQRVQHLQHAVEQAPGRPGAAGSGSR